MVVAASTRRGAVLIAMLLSAMMPAEAAYKHHRTPAGPQRFGPGERLEGVEPNSAAARAGLRPGDVILSINGQPIGNFYDIGPIVSRGGRVVIAVRRNGSVVRVIARPQNGILGVSKMVPGFGVVFGHSDETFIAPPPIPPTPPDPPFPIQAY